MACSIPDTLLQAAEALRCSGAGQRGWLGIFPSWCPRAAPPVVVNCMHGNSAWPIALTVILSLLYEEAFILSLLFLKRKKEKNTRALLFIPILVSVWRASGQGSAQAAANIWRTPLTGSFCPSSVPASTSSVRRTPLWEGFWKATYGSRRVEYSPRIKVFNFEVGL